MKTVAIIQARMGSNRLPGKVLTDIGDRPMVAHVYERVAAAESLDEVVLATTSEPIDDLLASYCEHAGWRCFRGDHLDVLDRYYQAGLQCGSDVVVRVTADCPLMDPAVIDQVLGEFHRHQPTIDYASNTLPPRTFPRGLDVEVFKFTALARAWREAVDPTCREHVTPYLYRSPGEFALLPVLSDIDASHYRWTVDTHEDLQLLRAVHEVVGGDSYSWRAALDIAERHPQWAAINGHIQQKAA